MQTSRHSVGESKNRPLEIAIKLLARWPGMLLCLFLTLIMIYLAMPSQQYDLDTLPELSRINNLDPTSPDPSHMLYALLGIPFYSLWLRLGYIGDALRAMQVLNAVFGAVTITVLALILRQVGIHRIIAVPISFAAGLSYAFWTHAEDAFFIIPAACFALGALLCALILADAQSLARRGVVLLLLALNVSLAALCYQTNMLLVLALMAASWAGSVYCRRWVGQWLLVGGLVAVLAGGVWLWQATQFAGAQTLLEAISWFFVSHGGVARGLWRREGVPVLSATVTAWIATVLPVYEGMRLRNLLHGKFSLWHLPSQAALLLLGVIALFSLNTLRHAWQKRHLMIVPARIWLTCGLWFVIPGLAVLWFDRAEVKLWLIPFFACWIGLAVVLNTRYLLRDDNPGSLLALGLVLTLPLAIGVSNFMIAVYPNCANESIAVRKAQSAVSQMHPNDLLISATFDWTSHVRYFCPDCWVVNAVGIAQNIPKEREYEVKQALGKHMATAWATGGRVYAVECLGTPTSPKWSWITPYTGLLPQDFADFDRQPAWWVEDELVWELRPASY